MTKTDDLKRKLEQLEKDYGDIGAYSEYGKVMQEMLHLFKDDSKSDESIKLRNKVDELRNKVSNLEHSLQKEKLNQEKEPKRDAKYFLKNARDLENRGQHLAAADNYLEALVLEKDKRTYRSLSRCFLNLQRFDEAINADESALKLDPKYFAPYVGLMVSYSAKKDLSSCQKLLRRVKKNGINWKDLTKGSREFIFYLGMIHYKLGQQKEAKRYFKMMKAEHWDAAGGYDSRLKAQTIQILESMAGYEKFKKSSKEFDKSYTDSISLMERIRRKL
jgi:tetratricopeptide (TPR) repeat protein